MNLYLISQNENTGYDAYDSAVVAARTPGEAQRMTPGGEGARWVDATWVTDPSLVNVELIGVAVEGTEAGVVCAG